MTRNKARMQSSCGPPPFSADVGAAYLFAKERPLDKRFGANEFPLEYLYRHDIASVSFCPRKHLFCLMLRDD